MTNLRRTVQLTGGGSYSVTLPKSWALSQGVKEGVIVSMESRDDGALVIVPERLETAKHQREIDLVDSPSVARDIVGGYLMGYDSIKIQTYSGFNSETTSVIRKCVRRLAGAEIVEELPNKVEIQILLDPDAVTPLKVLRRESALVNSMISDVLQAILDADKSLYSKVIERDEEADRQYFILVRMIRLALRNPEISRKMELTPLKLLDLRMVAKFLEDSGDQAESLAAECLGYPLLRFSGNLADNLRKLGELTAKLSVESVESFFAEDPERAIKVLEMKSSFEPTVRNLLDSAGADDLSLQAFLLRASSRFERISENSVDVAEMAAPMSLKTTDQSKA